MNYSPDLKRRIRARHHTGMSALRISEIYGVRPHDIDAVINETPMACSEAVPASGVATSKPMRLYGSLPPDIQTYALMVAKERGVPFHVLFSGRKASGQQSVLARGRFFHGLKCLFGWTYSKISTACGLSVTAIWNSIRRYCQSTGAQHPKRGRKISEEEYVLEN